MRWIPETVVKGVAYDTPILGYRVGTCNPLRLWKAEAVESFDFAAFNHGDYYRAVEEKMHSENITKVLYPNDEMLQGKTPPAATAVLLRQLLAAGHDPRPPLLERPLDSFHEKWAVQLNDTHPGHRRGRIDAPAGGRTPDGLGHGLARHRQHLRLHQPHPAARGSGEMAGGLFGKPAAAASGNHLRDQPPLSGRGPGAFPGR